MTQQADRLTSRAQARVPIANIIRRLLRARPTTIVATNKNLQNQYTNAKYVWGADGHPHLIGVAKSPAPITGQPLPTPPPISGYDTLHWDGDTLLFETDPFGHVDEVPVGTAGAILPEDTRYAGLTWYDRTPGGILQSCGNATGVNSSSPSGPGLENGVALGCTPVIGNTATLPTFVTNAKANSQNPATVGNGAVIMTPRTDGISDGINVLQGVRSYDNASGQWTTPDAYAGSGPDPMSQKAYMWNNNNSMSFSDASGYLAMLFYDSSGDSQAHATIDDPNEQRSVKKLVDKGTTYCECWSSDDAAYGASVKYSSASASKGVEYGAPVYALGGGNGFGQATIGEALVVNTVATIPGSSTLVGIWHSHVIEGSVDHRGDMQDTFDSAHLRISYWTSDLVNHSFYRQDWKDGKILPERELCGACVYGGIISL